MKKDPHNFEQFMKQREDAASAYVRGDAHPLNRITTHDSPASYFAPEGDHVSGAKEVLSRYMNDAKALAPGGENSFETLQMEASEGMAYWVGIQRAVIFVQGSKSPVPVDLRVTEVFRREGHEWKLVHRHAETLLDLTSVSES